MIKERLHVASYKISIFRDATKLKAAYLDESLTLEECGFVGSPNYNEVLKNADKHILYFDYLILDTDDPILKADFYFHNYKKQF